MLTLKNVKNISFDEGNLSIEVTYDGGLLKTYNISSAKSLQMVRTGSQWDLNISEEALEKETVILKFPKSLINLDFGADVNGGNYYYSLIIIGEEEIRDGLYNESNQFLIGMKSSPINLQLDQGTFIIKR